MMTWSDAIFLLPEIVLCIGASFLLLAPVMGFRTSHRSARVAMFIVLGVTLVSIIYASNEVEGMGQSASFHSMFVLDRFAIFFKVLFVIAVGLVAILSTDFLRDGAYSAWEYYSLLTFALCGMTFMASGVHLISIYIGLELLSLSSYILAGYYKAEAKSTEAAMKYFVLGTVSSAILLYGMSLIYGVCGTLSLHRIDRVLGTLVTNDALIIGIMMMAAGLCFKIAAVPFHVWTPDVYVGSPTPITAFLSTASKAAAFAVFARIFYLGLSDFRIDWGIVLGGVAALSMIVGNLAAITQDNIKRMLAYSSIAHAGYALLGIVAMNDLGVQGILVYMVVYVFANIGVWATVMMLSRGAYANETISDFQGLHRRSPFAAFCMVVFLLSLGGIPPTAGFIGKYFLFAAAVRSGYGWLAIIAVLTSAISMFYYLRVVVAMYLRDGEVQGEIHSSYPLRLTIAVCLIATLILGVLPEPLVDTVEGHSEQLLFTVIQR